MSNGFRRQMGLTRYRMPSSLLPLTNAAVAIVLASAVTTAGPRPIAAERAEQIALDHLRTSVLELGLAADDVHDVVVRDCYSSIHNGVTHVYLRQRFQGIPVEGAEITLNVTADGDVFHLGHRFLSNLTSRVRPDSPSLTMDDAVARATADQVAPTRAMDARLPAALVYYPMEDGTLRLAWSVEFDAQGEPRFSGNVVVDAVNGKVMERRSWTAAFTIDLNAPAAINRTANDRDDEGSQSMNPDSYQVFAIPKEHPDDGPRTTEIDPALDGGAASPFNWHDTNGVAGPEFTITRGNNAYGYTDVDNNNTPDVGSSPDGGAGLNFSFPLDLSQVPSTYRPAAVTNAFYLTNIVHDVLWNYGFNEEGRNFQLNNYGRGGADNDPVLVEVQQGGGFNNAFMSSPPDGSSPRMELLLWNLTSPARDAALANGIVIDLYFYGAAGRLVGNGNGLNNLESFSMRWGWSDWGSLVLTANPSDIATTSRGLGTYLLGQPPTGPGIRPRPYTTDFAVNDLTYFDLPSLQVPHGVGTVWATMLWEMYWELVDAHGFNPDIYGDWTTGGNNLALQLVIDGMKMTPFNPGFVDGRNAILAADQVLTGGANRCAIWRAFALRGLGVNATQGSSNSVFDGNGNSQLPPECETAGIEGASSGQLPNLDHELRAYPNPFNPQTNLSFTLATEGLAVLEIYDLQGRLVRKIEGGNLPAGRHVVAWNGRGDGDRALASGEYVVRLRLDDKVAATRKTMLVK